MIPFAALLTWPCWTLYVAPDRTELSPPTVMLPARVPGEHALPPDPLRPVVLGPAQTSWPNGLLC